jgi:hypothetical protein
MNRRAVAFRPDGFEPIVRPGSIFLQEILNGD